MGFFFFSFEAFFSLIFSLCHSRQTHFVLLADIRLPPLAQRGIQMSSHSRPLTAAEAAKWWELKIGPVLITLTYKKVSFSFLETEERRGEKGNNEVGRGFFFGFFF